jgi:hypothetical protein
MTIKTLTAISLTLLTLSATAQKKSDAVSSKKYQWEAGVKLGSLKINGDVAGKFGLNTGVWISRSLTSWFSVNAGYNYGSAKGMNWIPAVNFSFNPAWADKYAAPVRTSDGTLVAGYIRNGQFVSANRADKVYYNYKTAINQFYFCPKFSLWFPSSQPVVGIHLFAGINVVNYKSKVDALNSNGETYATLFNEINPSSGKSAILNKLKAGMDGIYETNADAPSKSSSVNAFGGIEVSARIKTRFTIGLEFSFIATKTDLLDGQRWQEQSLGDPMLTRDNDKIIGGALNLGFRF